MDFLGCWGGHTRKRDAAVSPHLDLIVRDYDEAIAWFTGVLGFTGAPDQYSPEPDKR
jgi:hypothetical protein